MGAEVWSDRQSDSPKMKTSKKEGQKLSACKKSIKMMASFKPFQGGRMMIYKPSVASESFLMRTSQGRIDLGRFRALFIGGH